MFRAIFKSYRWNTKNVMVIHGQHERCETYAEFYVGNF